MPQPWLILPLPPSDNAAHRIVTPHTSARTPRMVSVPSPSMIAYIEEARWRIKVWMPQARWAFPTPQTKIVLAFWIFWPDRRVRDPGNLIKVLGDACKGVLLPDDNMLLPRPMDFRIDRHHPRLACRVWAHRPLALRRTVSSLT